VRSTEFWIIVLLVQRLLSGQQSNMNTLGWCALEHRSKLPCLLRSGGDVGSCSLLPLCNILSVGEIVAPMFRPTLRSWLDSVGAPVGGQQRLMRHADTGTTMNMYGGAFCRTCRRAEELVSDIYEPRPFVARDACRFFLQALCPDNHMARLSLPVFHLIVVQKKEVP